MIIDGTGLICVAPATTAVTATFDRMPCLSDMHSSSSSSSSSVLSKVVANVDRVEMLPHGSVGTATACSFDIQSTGSGAETHGSQGTAATTSNFAMLSSGTGVIEVGGKGVVASTSAAAGIVATIAFNTGVEDLLIISLPFIILWAIVPQVLSQADSVYFNIIIGDRPTMFNAINGNFIACALLFDSIDKNTLKTPCRRNNSDSIISKAQTFWAIAHASLKGTYPDLLKQREEGFWRNQLSLFYKQTNATAMAAAIATAQQQQLYKVETLNY
uniref:Uncharacterized protein n=1 Tax=Glossina austeni TaxID=7395 RepID=A0A1A9VIB2_GLOAU